MIYAINIFVYARENLRRCQKILPLRNGINDATSGTAVNQAILFHLTTSGNVINNSKNIFLDSKYAIKHALAKSF
jgi:hypothetical protein